MVISSIKKTSISVDVSVKHGLDNMGKKGETYNDIVIRLLEVYENGI